MCVTEERKIMICHNITKGISDFSLLCSMVFRGGKKSKQFINNKHTKTGWQRTATTPEQT